MFPRTRNALAGIAAAAAMFGAGAAPAAASSQATCLSIWSHSALRSQAKPSGCTYQGSDAHSWIYRVYRLSVYGHGYRSIVHVVPATDGLHYFVTFFTKLP